MIEGDKMTQETFRDRVVIITGASSGIGREMAYQLAEQGAKLVLASRDANRLEEVAEKCRKYSQAVVVPTDVSKKAECEGLIKKTVDEFGRIDVLVNNAGLTMWARFDEIKDLETIERIMQINYWGSVYCTYYALPYLKQSKGRIIGVSSLTGKTGVPTRTGYSASKHAMVGFFDSLRIELSDTGVSVTMAFPGFVATEVRERALGPDGKPMVQSKVHEDKVMSAEECARLINKAALLRKREIVMTLRAKIGLWVKLIAPSVADSISKKSIAEGR